jgi:type IV pilus assembly protein PilA
LSELRDNGPREAGFTLVELLVVMAILGLLAAIAVPAFYGERDKARDADAKVQVRTAETAINTWASDHGGEFAGVGVPELQAIEPVLNDASLAVVGATDDAYELAVTSTTGNVFTIERATNGSRTFSCTDPGEDGCPQTGFWS